MITAGIASPTVCPYHFRINLTLIPAPPSLPGGHGHIFWCINGKRLLFLSYSTCLIIGLQAAAHVAGLVAYLLSLTGPISPATVISDLTTMSRKNVLSGVPSGTSNRLASNDVSQIGITI